MIIQISVAAGLSWWLAQRLLDHRMPYLAVVAAIICLGFSFGQRLTRALEVAVGVTIGVLMGDIFWALFGTGVWQIGLVIGVAMSVATWLGARTLMVNQAAVQAAIVLTIPPSLGAGFSRWGDALLGCAVALLFATVAPIDPVERPRLQAAKALHEASASIRAMVTAVIESDEDATIEVLEHVRTAEEKLSSLMEAVDEGMAVVRGSPFLRHKRKGVERIQDLSVPLDRFAKNLRVLARRGVVALHRDETLPEQHIQLLRDLAYVTDLCAAELYAGRLPNSAIDEIVAIGKATVNIELGDQLSPVVILAQVRSMLVDLIELSGIEYTDARVMIPRHS